jgi:hypothetical protein
MLGARGERGKGGTLGSTRPPWQESAQRGWCRGEWRDAKNSREQKICGQAPARFSPPPEPAHVHPPHGSGSWRSRTPTSLDGTSCWSWRYCRCRCRCRARVTDGDTTLAAPPSSPTPGSRRRRRRRRRRQTPGRVDLLPSSLLAHAGGIMMVRGNGLGRGLCAVVGAAAAAAPIDGRFRGSVSRSSGSVVDVLSRRSPVSRFADRVGGGRRRRMLACCAWSPSLSSRRPSP